MTARRDPKGDTRKTARVAPPSPKPLLTPERAAPSYSTLLPGADTSVGVLLAKLASIRGGYIKIRMDALGSTNHFTYTWTVGSNAGNYVYARFDYWELEPALHTLLRKVLEVEEGKLKPSPDKYLT